MDVMIDRAFVRIAEGLVHLRKVEGDAAHGRLHAGIEIVLEALIAVRTGVGEPRAAVEHVLADIDAAEELTVLVEGLVDAAEHVVVGDADVERIVGGRSGAGRGQGRNRGQERGLEEFHLVYPLVTAGRKNPGGVNQRR